MIHKSAGQTQEEYREGVTARMTPAVMDEPATFRPALALYDQASLAELLGVSKKTLQNLYSRTPHQLPAAIDIPGARGPRWTAQSILAWLDGRPMHTSTPVPVVTKRSVGRPRIAGGAK